MDIAGFGGYKDRLGQQTAERIVETVATLLQQQVREGDLLAHDPASAAEDVPGRFGGDEFCFMLANLPSCRQGQVIADRFGGAVSRYDWAALDARLDGQPIRVDVGVVCLKLGRLADRRTTARDLAARLVARADALMHTARAATISAASWARVEVENGDLVDVLDQTPAVVASRTTLSGERT